ncbi:ISAon1 family transposase N-terminal region protein [Arachidicoccus sp.]|uniref:ISAon1 family transposase N-terminal region protein n=1 Tax=Arachidicoccus sp. TaxID=1872624 RepID=UPI003D1DE1E8
MQDSYLSLLKFILPSYILDHFELISARNEGEDILHIELEEPNIIPAEFEAGKYHSKGFFPSITIQDFPLRGHRVYFHIKRRRWLKLEDGDKDKVGELSL